MTLRTTSATRRTVVSRSSEVANTSATSSSSDSTGKRSGLERTESIVGYDSSTFPGTSCEPLNRLKRLVGSGISSRAAPAAKPSDDANVGEVAILFRVIEPVADHKFIG